jgi:hypothetical protein
MSERTAKPATDRFDEAKISFGTSDAQVRYGQQDGRRYWRNIAIRRNKACEPYPYEIDSPFTASLLPP